MRSRSDCSQRLYTTLFSMRLSFTIYTYIEMDHLPTVFYVSFTAECWSPQPDAHMFEVAPKNNNTSPLISALPSWHKLYCTSSGAAICGKTQRTDLRMENAHFRSEHLFNPRQSNPAFNTASSCSIETLKLTHIQCMTGYETLQQSSHLCVHCA